MKQQLLITFDIVNQTISIEENDFTTLEALGILEGAKAMIINNWMEED